MSIGYALQPMRISHDRPRLDHHRLLFGLRHRKGLLLHGARQMKRALYAFAVIGALITLIASHLCAYSAGAIDARGVVAENVRVAYLAACRVYSDRTPGECDHAATGYAGDSDASR
jgi:hypothetical protein